MLLNQTLTLGLIDLGSRSLFEELAVPVNQTLTLGLIDPSASRLRSYVSIISIDSPTHPTVFFFYYSLTCSGQIIIFFQSRVRVTRPKILKTNYKPAFCF